MIFVAICVANMKIINDKYSLLLLNVLSFAVLQTGQAQTEVGSGGAESAGPYRWPDCGQHRTAVTGLYSDMCDVLVMYRWYISDSDGSYRSVQ